MPHFSKITRSYSRSMSFRRPDGRELWIRHESTHEASLDPDNSLSGSAESISDISETLHEQAIADVAASMAKEKKLIEQGFLGQTDEPFKGNGGQDLSERPKL